jgi:hypothetical protein
MSKESVPTRSKVHTRRHTHTHTHTHTHKQIKSSLSLDPDNGTHKLTLEGEMPMVSCVRS